MEVKFMLKIFREIKCDFLAYHIFDGKSAFKSENFDEIAEKVSKENVKKVITGENVLAKVYENYLEIIIQKPYQRFFYKIKA